MRIVLDTKSKGWHNFKRIGLGVFILIVILFVMAIIEHFSGRDLSFSTGGLCGVHIAKYKWRNDDSD